MDPAEIAAIATAAVSIIGALTALIKAWRAGGTAAAAQTTAAAAAASIAAHNADAGAHTGRITRDLRP